MSDAVSREDGTATSTLDEIRERLEEGAMSPMQWRAVAVAIGISIVDGYDVLSATFVIPVLQQEWGLEPSRLGAILASSLFGMALGSFLIAPLADLYGRRPLILAALGMAATGMLMAAHSSSLNALIICRAVTGLSVGTIMAVMSPVAAESTNKRRRALAISLIVIGFPIGGMLAGLTATLFFESFGWRIEFLVGAGLTAAMIPAVLLFLPEPLQSLLARAVPNRHARVNAMLQRLGHAPVDHLPPPVSRQRSYSAVFAPGQRAVTIWIATFQLILMQTVLFGGYWMPQIAASAGADTTTASLVGTIAIAAGIAGGLAFGSVTNTGNIYRMTMLTVLCLAIATAAIGLVPASPVMFIVVAAFHGIFGSASQAGFYTIVPSCFQPEARATGVGFVLGIARLGSATSPLIAGGLFSAGLDREVVCACFAAFALVAASMFLVQPPGAKTLK